MLYFFIFSRLNGLFSLEVSRLRSRLAGSNANNGTNAGAFCANSNNAVTWSNSNGSLPLYFNQGKGLAAVAEYKNKKGCW
jgi:hypothetical protein